MMLIGFFVSISLCIIGYEGTPQLLFANGKDVRIIDAARPQGNATIVASDLEDVAALDFVASDNAIFWADTHLEIIETTRIGNNGITRDVVTITSGHLSPDGLACDWMARKIYWTDSLNSRIEVCNLDGSHRKVLFWEKLDQPRAIALDPKHGYMYWTDWGEEPKIEKAGMDGHPNSRKTIIKDQIYWPNGLTVDYQDEQLYWVDAKLYTISRCDYDGNNRTLVVQGDVPHPFAITIFGDTLYWTDWHLRAINSCDKKTGENRKRLIQSELFSPTDIHVFDKARQPQGYTECSENNGGCSHLCLMSPYPPNYSCACPTGVKLLTDGKTCAKDAQKFLLLARRTDMRRISLDTPDHTDVVLPLDNVQHAIVMDFDPVSGYVYWTDDEVKVIRRAYLNGSKQENIITSEVQAPDGLAIDPVGRNLYWTDTGTNRIEVARLNGTSRRVLISEDLDEPRAIVLDPLAGYMYWTDWGEQEPKIERAYMDGTNRVTLINKNIRWPNGLALDFDQRKLYWADAYRDVIEVANMDGTDRKVLVDQDLPHVFGFTLLGDYIYWTDWQKRSIERAHKVRGEAERTNIIEQLPDLMGLKAVDINQQIGTNDCSNNNNGCSHLCLNRPQGPVCSCPMGSELLSNGTTCIIPDAFLLFSRRTDIRRMSLITKPSQNDVIPIDGVKQANVLDFDINDNKIYWTDITLKSISRAFMNGSNLEKVITVGLQDPEGMAVDWVAHNLYWADFGARRIEMSRIDGSSRKVLVWENVRPRSIALDPPKGKMYWSDWDKTNIEVADLDGSNRKTVIQHGGRAIGLTIDFSENRIYWTNMDDKLIESANLDGTDRRLVLGTALPNPYSLTQYKDYIYWADWETNSIERASKVDGKNRTQIQGDLDYIMDILVFHKSRQSGNNNCSVSNGGCSHICIADPSPVGPDNISSSYHCACPTHFKLDMDGKSCVAPEEFMLFSQKNVISRMSLNFNEEPDLVLPIPGLRNIKAMAYDPVDQYIYWVDSKTKNIKRARENGSDVTNLLPARKDKDEHSQPFDIAIDPYSRLLYFTDAVTNVINITRLDMTPVGVVVGGKDSKSDQKPRKIALAPTRGLMFWTNMARNGARIEIANMDGTSQRSLINMQLEDPAALAVDEKAGKVYWSDSGYQRIEVADFDAGNRRTLIDNKVTKPIGFAVYGDYLYWADRELQTIERVNKSNTIERDEIQSRVQQLSDIEVVRVLTKDDLNKHPCSPEKNKCSHICVVAQDSKDAKMRCSCPEGLMLMDDHLSCGVPPTCTTEEFSCVSDSSCIPYMWVCDGAPECHDSSDEQNCPTCGDDEFRCKNGKCISMEKRCDGNNDCQGGSDEDDCAPCKQHQFMCQSDRTCIDKTSVCNGHPDCPGGTDEHDCDHGASEHIAKEGNNKMYLFLGVFLAFLFLVMIFLVFFTCIRRRKQHTHMMLEESTDTNLGAKLLVQSSSSQITPPQTLSSRGAKSGTTCFTMTSGTHSAHSSSAPLYDRNTVTGKSSSSSAITTYPHETLNPPPSPVTDRSQYDLYYESNTSPSTVRAYHSYGRRNEGRSSGRHRHKNIPPPAPTPCSTDVCEDSEPYSSKKYYDRDLNYDSDPFYPPPPTPRSQYFSDIDPSCPPSPSTERSFFNPYPPPPSPVGTSEC